MNNEEDGYSLGERSTIFEYYVESFPNSMIGQEFREKGLRAIETGGGFRTALYEGDIESALFRADRSNQFRLLLVLRDRIGYPVGNNLSTEKIEADDGERDMHWGELMQELRDNNAYPE